MGTAFGHHPGSFSTPAFTTQPASLVSTSGQLQQQQHQQQQGISISNQLGLAAYSTQQIQSSTGNGIVQNTYLAPHGHLSNSLLSSMPANAYVKPPTSIMPATPLLGGVPVSMASGPAGSTDSSGLSTTGPGSLLLGPGKACLWGLSRLIGKRIIFWTEIVFVNCAQPYCIIQI